MGFKQGTGTDRETIPALDEDELIQASETRLTKYAAPLLAVVALGLAAVLSNTGLGSIPKYDDLPESAKGLAALGLLLIVVAVILGVSVIMAADIRARGDAVAANFALRMRPPLLISPPGASGQSTGLRVKRQGYGADDQWTVITGQTDAAGDTKLLVARGDDTPVWIPMSEVTAWELPRPPA